tara:strand:- start:4483 stop:4902 length:420 start_codon:yes stop_codon:yes gene_type:complete
MSDSTYYSLHEANAAVNAIRQEVSRIYQMNTLLKKHLHHMDIDESMDLSLHDFNHEITLDSASSVKILLRCIEDTIHILSEVGCRLVSIEKGIIEWPTLVGDDEVYLRWKIRQSSISEWYDPKTDTTHRISDQNLYLFS